MTDSILESVKATIGDMFSDTDGAFDAELITHINAVFVILRRMGVGPDKTFSITGATETWDDFSTDDYIGAVKSYVPLKVKQSFFDPATSSVVKESTEATIAELEWTLNFEADCCREEAANAD